MPHRTRVGLFVLASSCAACGGEMEAEEEQVTGAIIGGSPSVDTVVRNAAVLITGIPVGGTCTGTLVQRDVVLTAAHLHPLSRFGSASEVVTSHQNVPAVSAPETYQVADVNGDGRGDLVAFTRGTHEVKVATSTIER